MATHSSILAWEIPWTEEPGGLQPKGLQRVGHDWAWKIIKLSMSKMVNSLHEVAIAIHWVAKSWTRLRD